MIDGNTLAKALLEELAALASEEDGRSHDLAWVKGYVAGMSNAASIAIELAEENRRMGN